MYSYLRGTLVEAHLEHVVLDVNGLGFCLFIAPGHYTKLPAERSTLCLYTSFVIREFSQSLYGFLHAHERDLFDKLLDISGVGPKLALNIVGHLPREKLEQVWVNKDVNLLCTVPGIGKKTAERLILELKGVMAGVTPVRIQTDAPHHIRDAISALINLGYSPQASQAAVTKTGESNPDLQDTGALISKSLQLLYTS